MVHIYVAQKQQLGRYVPMYLLSFMYYLVNVDYMYICMPYM